MDQALKLFIDALFDGEALVSSCIANKGFSVSELPAAEKFVLDIPMVIPQFGEAKSEAEAITPEMEADLVAYIVAKGVGETAKAQAILAAAVKLAFAAYELAKALELPSAAPAA